MRVKQPNVARGSLRWVRELICNQPGQLTIQLESEGSWPSAREIEWVSPQKDDEYAEYRDETALGLLGVADKVSSLADFWPRRGPQWDALGKFGERGVVLVEAKANLKELSSPPTQASEPSLTTIKNACASAQQALGGTGGVSWVGKYYQYANRLAHWHFLREMNRLDAHLVFVYFLNDPDTNGPSNVEEWKPAIQKVHEALGLPERLPAAVHEVFIDVNRLQ